MIDSIAMPRNLESTMGGNIFLNQFQSDTGHDSDAPALISFLSHTLLLTRSTQITIRFVCDSRVLIQSVRIQDL